MPVNAEADPTPMASAPMRYGPDGSVDWGNMWESFCALAQEGGPPHRGTLLRAPQDADTESPAYRFAVAEIARGIRLVSGLQATPASAGWLALACASTDMARWLADAIEVELVEARAVDCTLYVPVGEWQDIKQQIKNVITVVAKTAHFWSDHLLISSDGQRVATSYTRYGREAIPRVHTQPVVLDVGEDTGSLVIYTNADLRGKEIELSPKGDDAARKHTDVAERRFSGRSIFAAVYLPMPAGVYTIWEDYATPIGEVSIVAGEITQLDWRS